MPRHLAMSPAPFRPSPTHAEQKLLLNYLDNEKNKMHVIELLERLETRANLKNKEIAHDWLVVARRTFKDDKPHTGLTHMKTWESLSQALAAAPVNSDEYLLALDARSKLLLHMKYYRECELDVDRALERLENRQEMRCLQGELLLRKLQCWKHSFVVIPRFLVKRFLDCLDLIPDKNEVCRIYGKVKRLGMLNLLEHADEPDLGQNVKLPPVESRALRTDDRINANVVYNANLDLCVVADDRFYTGDVVLVENYYATMLTCNFALLCGHCLATSWTSIPCHTCKMMFCSERCRDKAMLEYHSYECALYRYELSSEFFQREVDLNVKLGMRMLLMARIECGSNEKLFQEIKYVSGTDAFEKEFDKKYAFRPYFALGHGLQISNSIICWSIVLLIMAAKHCNLFQNAHYELKTIDSLIYDPCALQIGALIMRFSAVAQHYARNYVEPYTKIERDASGEMHFIGQSELARGLIVARMSSYFNHSCFPNASRICNDAGQVIIYVTRPVARNEELVICYGFPYYSTMSASDRQRYLLEKYGISCKCVACSFEYPSSPPQDDAEIEHFVLDKSTSESLVNEIEYKIEEAECKINSVQCKHRKSIAAAIDSISAYHNLKSSLIPKVVGLRYMLQKTFEETIGVWRPPTGETKCNANETIETESRILEKNFDKSDSSSNSGSDADVSSEE